MCLYETLYLCLSFKHIKFRIMSMCWATLSIHRHCSSMNRHGMLVYPRDQYPLKYHSDKHDERQCEETKSQYRLEVILVKNKESNTQRIKEGPPSLVHVFCLLTYFSLKLETSQSIPVRQTLKILNNPIYEVLEWQ